MPTRSDSSGELTPEARKHLLLVACTVDRLMLSTIRRRKQAPLDALTQVARMPWLDLALTFGTRLLPRGARRLGSIVRLWRRLSHHGGR